MGTAAVLTPGTELCHKEDVEKILPEVLVWEIPVNQRKKGFTASNENSTVNQSKDANNEEATYKAGDSKGQFQLKLIE